MSFIRTLGGFILVIVGALATITSCGTTSGGTGDAAVDTFGSCTTSADCPSGTDCLYPTGGGCSTSGACVPQTTCSGDYVCTCDGQTRNACGTRSPKPVAHLGPCVTPDAEGGPSGEPLCENDDISGFNPPSMGKPVVMASACNSAQLTAFVTACWSATSNSTSCAKWMTADAGACGACLVPALQSDTAWGPFDCETAQSACDPNSGGCVDVLLGTVADEKGQGGAGSCGDATTTADSCLGYACGACGAADLDACEQFAEQTSCKGYIDAETAITGACASLVGDAASSASVCFPKTDADHVAFLNVFCGTGP